ncbi:type II secretion system protein GspD [Deinococcus sp.]|uniref:type II secretion system protein GspD n=1 Tax=Deinococcus sp. TaxID=47478 RepID=UPI0034C5BD7B
MNSALALLGQVDKPLPVIPVDSGPKTVQKVFQLVNASAEEVKATLEGTLARDLTNAAATEPLPNVPVTATDANGNTTVVSVPNAMAQVANQGTAAQGQSAQTAAAASTQQATLIADKRTNTLIVRGTPEQVAQIAELVPQLDQVVPQVNVQVRIQEITKEASNSLGLNWRASFGGFNVAVGGNGLQGTFNPTQSFVGFNIFPTLRTLESQNLTRTVYDGNVTMQSGQRSLASTGGAQNASSAAAASIKSGGRLELNIPSPAGNIVRQIDYGLNLDFFDPQVAPDGSITLRVRGQVNNLKTAVAAGAELPNNLDFANSEAQSTITFKSGQTVLMSGLLSTNNTDTRSGVPFLSTLPVVGGAFGEQTKRKRETQLLIIVTGTIVK